MKDVKGLRLKKGVEGGWEKPRQGREPPAIPCHQVTGGGRPAASFRRKPALGPEIAYFKKNM